MKNIFLLIGFILLTSGVMAQNSQTGKITVVKGNMVTVKTDAMSPLPAKNDSCSISKDISGTQNPFGIKVTSGWMGVGDAVVFSQKGDVIIFKIVKETSNITVNGKKKPNFEVGKKVKIEWK